MNNNEGERWKLISLRLKSLHGNYSIHSLIPFQLLPPFSPSKQIFQRCQTYKTWTTSNVFETIILSIWNLNCEENLLEKCIRKISLDRLWKRNVEKRCRFYSRFRKFPRNRNYWPECRGHVTLDRFNHTRRLTKDLLPCKPLFDHEHRALESSRKYVERIRVMFFSATRTDMPTGWN